MRNVWPPLLLVVVVLVGTYAYFTVRPLLEADSYFSRCDGYDPSYSQNECNEFPTP